MIMVSGPIEVIYNMELIFFFFSFLNLGPSFVHRYEITPLYLKSHEKSCFLWRCIQTFENFDQVWDGT